MRSPNGSLASRDPYRAEATPGVNGSDGLEAAAILVVDDEPFIVDIIAFLLEDEGFHVLRAYDGEQAWTMVSQRRPDLIISDVYMPHLTGLDFLNRLRQRPPLSQIPVILMSAARRELAVPNATFLSKPFDLDRMLALVHTALAAR